MWVHRIAQAYGQAPGAVLDWDLQDFRWSMALTLYDVDEAKRGG